MDQTIPPSLSCHNCATVTTDGGQQVWVCEKCGEENHVPTLEEKQAQAIIDAATKAASPVASAPNSTPAPNQTPKSQIL